MMPGTRIGSHEVIAALGAGGMGQVYRARDTNLGREVAIKILPEAFASDPERVARFEREARVLASLNHPNIATIHGLERANGQSFLIMELVAGETLATRVERGPIPVDEALPLAVQIAAALEAAHEKGVVHRDLKPANIAVTPDGKLKVLDFGLAKALADEARAIDVSQSPTMAQGPSSSGMILGTAAYMSPEQARGKPVDKRADIWAFGCVLFEMLTGKAAFAGETLTDIIAAVVKNEPEWTALPANTPEIVRALLRRCLKKDPARRLHDAADTRIELEEVLDEPLAPSQGLTARRLRSSFASRILWVLVAVLATSLVVIPIVLQRPEPSGLRIVRLELNLPPGIETSGTNSPSMAISPDDTQIVFSGGFGGLRRLYARRLDGLESTPFRGTETMNMCVFSPDGRAVAFVNSDRTLRKVALADGLVTTILRDVDYNGTGAAWGTDDRITFVRAGSLWQVPSEGGRPEQLTVLDSAKNELLHSWPTVVPDAKAILFTSVVGTNPTTTRIEALSLASRQRHIVVDAARSPILAASGHLLFFRDGSLIAAPFDAEKLETTGPAVAVLSDIALDQVGIPLVAVSNGGTLAYVPSNNATKRLVWVSRQGVEQLITDVSRPYVNPRLSPDGHRIVVEVAGGDLWIQDLERGTFTRLTSGDTIGNTFAAWTPDAERIVFRTLNGPRESASDGSGGSRSLGGTTADIPTSVSPDGNTLAFIRQGPSETGADIYTLSLRGDPDPRAFVTTAGYDGGGQFSPDGHWMAYVTNESGQFEVYLRPYPGPDKKFPVSTQGGSHPRWNPNGKELFYRNGFKMMAVDVSTSPESEKSETISATRALRAALCVRHRSEYRQLRCQPGRPALPDGQG